MKTRTTEAVLRLPQVRQRVGLSRSTIYALAAEGAFPLPIKLGARAAGWLASEIDAWLAARIEASRGR
jgi:prophage regulatory protein